MTNEDIKNNRIKNIVSQIYDIVNKAVVDKNGTISKKNLYRGIISRENKNGAIMDDAQISKYMNGKQAISDYLLSDIPELSEKSWLRTKIENIDKKGIEEAEEVIKQELMNLVQKEFGNHINGGAYTPEQLIAILIVHALRNSILPHNNKHIKVYCVGREKETKKLDDLIKSKDADKSVLISGPNLIGKTEFVLHYMQEEKCLFAYYDYSLSDYACYNKIKEKITLSEIKFLKKIASDCCPYEGLEKNELLQRADPEILQVIVVDNYSGDEEELNNLFGLVKGSNVALIVITTKNYEKIENQIRLEPLTPEQIVEVFYLFNTKNGEDELVKKISEKVLGQAWLMSFIAKWYANLKRKKQQEAYSILEKLSEEMDSNTCIKLEGDMKYHVSSSSSELKLVGHIHKIAKEYLSKPEKSTYMLLSCLSGVEMPKEYLIKWLNLDEEILDDLCEAGWCIISGEEGKVSIRIPKIVAMANCKINNRKAPDEFKIISDFMEKFSREIRYEEYGVIDTGIIRTVINNLHNFCIESGEYSRDKSYKNLLESFHLDCRRYYLMMCDADSAKKLRTDWGKRLEIDESKLSVRMLNMIEKLLEGDTSELINLENEYFRPLYNNEKNFTESEIVELMEITQIMLDIFWAYIERKYLESKEIVENYIDIIGTYTKVYEKIINSLFSKKRAGLFDFTINRYQLPLHLVKYTYLFKGYITNYYYSKIYELDQIYCNILGRTKLSRLEKMEKMRFMLDFQFIWRQYVLMLPFGYKQLQANRRLNKIKSDSAQYFLENINIFPADIQVKYYYVFQYCDNSGKVRCSSPDELVSFLKDWIKKSPTK